jgi:hypothetical protein
LPKLLFYKAIFTRTIANRRYKQATNALVLVVKIDNRNLMTKLDHTRNVMNIDFIVNLMDYIVIRLSNNLKRLL